jgi:predicted helicase
LTHSEPYYFFVEKDFSLQANYDGFVPIPKIFEQSSSGIKTHRDHFVIGFTDGEIKQRMRIFTSNLPDDLVVQSLDLKNTRDWEITKARERVKEIDWAKYIRRYSYRPFDDRKACYMPDLIDRGCDRWDLMQNFFDDNLGLCITRQLSTPKFYHAFVTRNASDMCFISIKTKETGYAFPLYIYPSKEKRGLFHAEQETRESNIKPDILKFLSKTYKREVTPEEIFYYIYGVLYTNKYRVKYAEFLKIDFPRVPLIKNYKLFKKVSECGNRLTDLHLLESPELDQPVAKFQGKGDNRVEKVKYGQGKVYINNDQHFEGISPEIWEYQIGGYQVCDKWLKDRKGRLLSLDDIKHYCKVVTAIKNTIGIQKEIDSLYPEIEKQVIESKNPKKE